MEAQTLGMIHAEGQVMVEGTARELSSFIHIPTYDHVKTLLHERGLYKGPVTCCSKTI